jgi:hypothetical protein
MSMKNSNDTIGNGARDLPVCSPVPKPTAPPRAPHYIVEKYLTHNHERSSSDPNYTLNPTQKNKQ